MPWFLLVVSIAFGSGGPIPKNAVGFCQYQDRSIGAKFAFYLIQHQESYLYERYQGHRYYISITPDAEFLLVGVAPLDINGQIDQRKYVVGRKFNTITRDSFFDERGDQNLSCSAI